jgi:predicted amidohydrolase
VDRLVVACVQQRMHLPHTLDDYREDLRRFLRVAVAKQARLVLFPELGGVMVAPPILGDVRSRLLKQADRGRQRQATTWQRLVGSLAGSLATLLKADFRLRIAALLDVAAPEVWHSYVEVFGGLAREFGVVVVAPSAYLPDPVDGVIRNLACVFSANGELLGHQAKVVLHPEDVGLAQPGSTWDVIESEVGRLGLILGSDVLYPEVGRLLAYAGADALIVQAACIDPVLYQKLRAGVLARMQDNQLYAAVSFLVGDNRISRVQRTPFVGKSAIFAPQELTPRANGVLVEMGNQRSEGVLAAPWDFPALKRLWESSDTPVRQTLPLLQAGQMLAQLYARLQSLPGESQPAQLASVERPVRAPLPPAEIVSLEELSVISSVTSRWPLPAERPAEPLAAMPLAAGNSEPDEVNSPVEEVAGEALALDLDEAGTPAALPATEDETDEMDVVTKSTERSE